MIIPEKSKGFGSFDSCPRFPKVSFGSTYKRFMRSMKHCSDATKKRYSVYLAEFLLAHQSTTEDFLVWILENKNPDDQFDTDYLDELLTNYYDSLFTRKVRPQKFNSVIGHVKAINHFLKGSRQDFSYSYKPRHLSRQDYDKMAVTDGQKKMEREDMQFLMESTANRQYKAMMMIMKDTGLRAGDIGLIQYKHIREALGDNPPDYITFEILPTKNIGQSNLIANPVMGPDSIKYLNRWIVYKKRKFGERTAYETSRKEQGLYRLEVRPIAYSDEDEDYVFCKMESKHEYTTTDGRYVPTKYFGDMYGFKGVTMIFQNLKKNYKKEFAKKSAHSFRKTHFTGLSGAKVPERWINVMQGRLGEGTQGAYVTPNSVELMGAYKKGYHAISLEKSESEELKIKQAQIDSLQHALDTQMAEMKAEFEGFKASLEK